MTANAFTDRQACAHHCRTTRKLTGGRDQRDGPYPGTYGEPGDVRRCEHGRVWLWRGTTEGMFFQPLDVWRRISRFGEPVRYRRAVRAIEAAGR